MNESHTDWPEFERPPVVEVYIGAHFIPHPGLRVQHIGRFWELVKDEYPHCSQRPVYSVPLGGNPPSALMFPDEVVPMPRFFFEDEKREYLLQVQNCALLLNWRKCDESVRYPRFNSLLESYQRELGRYQQFLDATFGSGHPLPVVQLELAYINAVDVPRREAGALGFLRPIEMFASSSGLRNHLASLTARSEFAISDSLAVSIAVDASENAQATGKTATFQFAAFGPLAEPQSIEQWLENAHKALLDLFVRATDESVQIEMWGRQ